MAGDSHTQLAQVLAESGKAKSNVGTPLVIHLSIPCVYTKGQIEPEVALYPLAASTVGVLHTQ